MIWTNVRPAVTKFNRPATNVVEADDAYTLQLALPGWNKSDVTLDVDGDLLHVRGARPDTEEDASPAYRRREFGLDKFDKSFHLPESVDVDAIAAALEQGVLSITLPKVAEAQPVRKAIAVA